MRGGHDRVQLALIEVDGDEPNVGGGGREDSSQHPAFGGLGIRVVDLEHGDVGQAAQPVGAGVEAGAENHELLDVVSERGRDDVIDQPGACDDGGPHARPSVVDESRHEPRGVRGRGRPGSPWRTATSGSPCQRIAEEPSVLRQVRLERAE